MNTLAATARCGPQLSFPCRTTKMGQASQNSDSPTASGASPSSSAAKQNPVPLRKDMRKLHHNLENRFFASQGFGFRRQISLENPIRKVITFAHRSLRIAKVKSGSVLKTRHHRCRDDLARFLR